MCSCFHQNKKRIRILRGHRSLSACFPAGPHHTPCKQHPCSVSWQSGNSSVRGKHTTPPMTHRAGAANASLPHFLKPWWRFALWGVLISIRTGVLDARQVSGQILTVKVINQSIVLMHDGGQRVLHWSAGSMSGLCWPLRTHKPWHLSLTRPALLVPSVTLISAASSLFHCVKDKEPNPPGGTTIPRQRWR